MTERKPADMSFTSWIDQQISEAAQRGAFDNLPGAGKPIPRRSEEDAGQAWLRDYALREGVPAHELLPAPLRLRKEIEQLPEVLRDVRSEAEVRDVIADLNRRIMHWRRIPLGPPVFVPAVDAELAVSTWRAERAASQAAAAMADGTGQAGQPEPAARRRWRRLRHRRLR